MNPSRALIGAILVEGPDALAKALAAGITPEKLGDAGPIWSEIISYFQQYGRLPSEGFAEYRYGSLGAIDPSPLLIEEVNRGFLSRRIQEGLSGIANKSPTESLSALERLVTDLKSEQRGGRVESLFKLGPDVRAFYERIQRGERGITTPWPTINWATMGFWPEDVILWAARTGIGKCVDAATELMDPVTGVLHTIEEFYSTDTLDRVVSWTKETGIHSHRIGGKVDTGRKDCLEFTLATGRSVIVTPEHPFLTADGWKRADELSVSDTVAIPKRMPMPEKPEAMDSAELDLLTILLAEGSTTGHHLGFSSEDPKIVAIATSAADSLDARVKHVNGVDYDFVGKVSGVNKVYSVSRDYGVHGKLAKNKTIPDAVFGLPPEQLRRFLTLFWMCDGYVDKTGPCVCLASKRMVAQLQHLLLRIGVQSTCSYKKASCAGKSFDSWRLRIHAESLPAFLAGTALWGEKRARTEALTSRTQTQGNPNLGNPHVSEAFKAQLVAKIRNPNGKGYGSILLGARDRLGWDTYVGIRNICTNGTKDRLSRSVFEAVVEEAKLESEYGWIYNSDLFWDEVVGIEAKPDRKIYDLSIPPASCFVANDILVHNTWLSILLANHAWSNPRKIIDPATGETRDVPNKVLFITTEISKIRIGMRYFAVRERLPYGELVQGRLTFVDQARFYKAVDDLLEADGLYIIGGDFDFKFDTVQAAIEESKPDIVIIDGVYLLRVAGGAGTATRTDKMATVFDEVKRLAKRKKVPVVISAQFNRNAKKEMAKTADLEAISLSDVGGWNADLVYGLIQTDEMKANGEMIIKPLKVREGAGSEVLCNWDFRTMNFLEKFTEGGGGGDADENLTNTGEILDSDDRDLPF